MCGICGKLDFQGKVVDKALIKKMCDSLQYRGPDAEGLYTGPYIGLGQRRLSVIDLNEIANPPLSNEDNTLWVVFNGEIYNYRALRNDLIDKGHVFRTKSDTEVIVHLYEEFGAGCLNLLRGMFAFAIWDSRNRKIFAARDRLGKKPFYYTRTNSSFIFGSEIKSILKDPEVSSDPDFFAIDRYLSRQYVPSPLTAFAGIQKLPPAHYLECDEKGTIVLKRFWKPPQGEKIDMGEEELVDELLRLLRESVRLRLNSDVPLGALLSGGIDSGSIVALMAMESSKPVQTFSIGFEEEEYSELPFARKVSERYNTDHHEFVVKPSIIEILPSLVRHYNEPFADSSAVPTYYICKMARKHVTVALSGDGGDESFAGYSHYFGTLAWERIDFIPAPVRKLFFGFLERAAALLPFSDFQAKADRAFHMIASQLPDRYLTQTAILKNQEKQGCYTPYFKSLIRDRENPGSCLENLEWDSSMNSLEWMMRHDLMNYLPDCLMVKTDVASMAHGLELRAPFLDHKLVEFAARIPVALKYNKSGRKSILKKAVGGFLPEEIIKKPKTGFGIPLAKWFRGDLSDLLRGLLLDKVAKKRGLFRHNILERMVDDQISGKRDWSNRLWAFLFLELWFREFID